MKKLFLILFIAVSIGFQIEAHAQNSPIPQMVAYQGFLSVDTGAFSGTIPASFSLFDAESGGNSVWEQTVADILVSKGYYSTYLDFNLGWKIGINGQENFTKQYWLQVLIGTNPLGNRIKLGATPYAINARRAEIADSSAKAFSSKSADIADSSIKAFKAKSADSAGLALKLVQDAPIGTIVAFGGSIFTLVDQQKSGWFVCDGRGLKVVEYPEYRDKVGQTYGVNSAGDTVYLPDLRGLFLRGVNGARADSLADPDKSSRFANREGGFSANNVGTMQMDELKSHKHEFSAAGTDGRIAALGSQIPYNHYQNLDTKFSGGAEPPKNAAVYWLIKVK